MNFFGDQQWGDATGSAAKLLKDEARPIAVYFAKLPELVLHRECPGGRRTVKTFAILLTVIFVTAGSAQARMRLLAHLRPFPDLH